MNTSGFTLTPGPVPAPVAPDCPPTARLLLFVWLGLGALVLLAYANSFQAGLVLDSRIIIGSDPRIRAWSAENLRLIFTQNYWWPYAASDLYRPLTTLTYLFNYTILGNGERVAGYHLVNFLLHWTNAWLVFLLVRQLGSRVGLAALTAAIFAVHPIGVEAVTNIVGRADLLATLSILAGGWCYLRSAGTQGARKVLWLAALGLITCLGVFVKESAVMVGPFLVLYDWLWRWPRLPEGTWRTRLPAAAREFGLKGYSALLPALILFFAVRHQLPLALTIAAHPFVDNPIVQAGFFAGPMTAIGVIGRYLGLLVVPYTLSADYSYNQIPLFGESAAWWQDLLAWASLAVIAVLLRVAVRWRSSHPLFAWGVLLFFVMLLPTANLIVPIGSIMAERFLYLPSMGFAVVAALGIRAVAIAAAGWQLDGRTLLGPAATIAIPTILTGALILRTHVRNADWRDEISLWKKSVATSPDSFKTHKGYAGAIWDAGGNEVALDAAIAEIEISHAILEQTPLPIERRDPTHVHARGLYYRLKGEFLQKRGLPDEARRYLVKATEVLLRGVEVNRWTNEVRKKKIEQRIGRGRPIPNTGDFGVHAQLGLTYADLNEWDGLASTAREIQEIAPKEAVGYSLAGVADLNKQRHEEAIVQFFASLILQPGDLAVRNTLINCYEKLGVQPLPVRANGANTAIDVDNAFVRRHLDQAYTLLVKNHEAGGFPDAAATLRETGRKNMEAAPVPASVPGTSTPK